MFSQAVLWNFLSVNCKFLMHQRTVWLWMYLQIAFAWQFFCTNEKNEVIIWTTAYTVFVAAVFFCKSTVQKQSTVCKWMRSMKRQGHRYKRLRRFWWSSMFLTKRRVGGKNSNNTSEWKDFGKWKIWRRLCCWTWSSPCLIVQYKCFLRYSVGDIPRFSLKHREK